LPRRFSAPLCQYQPKQELDKIGIANSHPLLLACPHR
jgi:hypothetical protein